jgi:hypothetical protein
MNEIHIKIPKEQFDVTHRGPVLQEREEKNSAYA